VNPGGFYTYQVTNYDQGDASYVITCPGNHDPGTMTAIGGTSAKTHIEYSSQTGFAAR
jgi:hypothetical protein